MENLIRIVRDQFKLDIHGDHGIRHWERVKVIGNYLAKEAKADSEVVNLFAYLHDSKREDDSDDPLHGTIAAEFTKELYDQGIIKLSEKQLDQLIFACKFHSQSNIKSEDVTIQTCWDADRLDLWRLGIKPNPYFLNTSAAKKEDNINFAKSLIS